MNNRYNSRDNRGVNCRSAKNRGKPRNNPYCVDIRPARVAAKKISAAARDNSRMFA